QKHELQFGYRGVVLGIADLVHYGTVVEPVHSPDPTPNSLLGHVRETTARAREGSYMNRRITRLVTCFVIASLCPSALGQVSRVRVGFCAKTISSGAAPFAIATRMGWFKEDGIEVTVVPLAGSSDC